MTAKHAPGWTWRKDTAGRIARPWAWSEINGGDDLPAQIGGLCQDGWHTDCPQAPNPAPGLAGTCTCTCHRALRDVSTIHAPTLTRWGWMLHHYFPASHYIGRPAPNHCLKTASHSDWSSFGFMRRRTIAGLDWPVLFHSPSVICEHPEYQQDALFDLAGNEVPA